jgi:hypothetical protein
MVDGNDYTNITLETAHRLRYILYARRFGGGLYSRLQVVGCHYADGNVITVLFLQIMAKVVIEPGAFLKLG